MESYSSIINIEINKIKSIDKFENLINDYFLHILFNYLEKKKLLDILKYNKHIKKRINININDYKECLEKYSSIEIEIKTMNNKCGFFINILYENSIYYHIYFNNKKEKIKRNYINENEKIKIIKIKIDYQIKSFKDLFHNCKCIESISFKKFYRNDIKDMSNMFSGFSSLKELNLNNFNTNNVTDMSFMFSGCSSLKELNFNNYFITNNVTNMCHMFSYCSSLEELNLNNFITNNVTNMSFMFYECSSLKELSLNNFNTKNITNIHGMIDRCSNELIIKIKTQYKNIKKEAFGFLI